MEENNEITTPGYMKLLEFEDLIKYAKKINRPLTRLFFSKYGFMPGEINWIEKFKEDVIKMHNEDILKQNNNTIKKLQQENIKLKEELNNFKNNNEIGWKSKNSLKIKKLSADEWLVEEHRTMKHTGDIYKTTHYIPTKNVKDIYKILHMLTDEDDASTGYRQVVSSLINKHKLDVDIESFNGGKNRSKYLFPLYYYPIKILEKKGYIKYGGAGKITLLKIKEVEL